MKNFLQQKFPRMKFQDDTARGRRGFILILEILIFLAVFYVGQTITSIPVAIFTVIALFTDETFMEIIQNTVSSSDVSLTEYMEQIQEVTVRITEKILLPTLFCTVLATIVSLLYCRVLEKRPLSSLGFRRGHILREYLAGLAVGGGMFAAAVGLACLTGSVKIVASGNMAIGMIVAFFVGYLLQGMSEEVLCRGYFMVSMARRNKMAWAVLISSIAFSALHLFNPGAFTNFGLPLVNIALFGLLEALYFLKRGDIWGGGGHPFCLELRPGQRLRRIGQRHRECPVPSGYCPVGCRNHLERRCLWSGRGTLRHRSDLACHCRGNFPPAHQ